MRVQLALIDAMQEELLKRLGTGESGQAWDEAKKAGASIRARLASIREAAAHQDSEAAGARAKSLLSYLEATLLPLLERGVGEEAARRELVDLWGRRAKLIRVQQQGESTVPVEVLASLQARFVALMAKYIQDQRALSLLVGELREMALPGFSEASGAVKRLAAASREQPAIDVASPAPKSDASED